MSGLEVAYARAATLIEAADGLLVTAGAGMGIDSGLPDFRGPGGFWSVYPALGRAGLRFEAVANPRAFEEWPELAWGFYGHRLRLYRETAPHPGFALLRRLGEGLPQGCFVFTSNVDGHFQKAGFAPGLVCEVHGSIHHLQCIRGCRGAIWSAADFYPAVDEAACRLVNEPPSCPHCGGLARPNILMFGDGEWLDSRQEAQMEALRQWREGVGRLVVIELGAGTAIPTVRYLGESSGGALIRINPDEAGLNRCRGVSLPVGALAGVRGIVQALGWPET